MCLAPRITYNASWYKIRNIRNLLDTNAERHKNTGDSSSTFSSFVLSRLPHSLLIKVTAMVTRLGVTKHHNYFN
jgi:hypothetical protein